jgi:catechol 2,3-dioxygenase-like lactoylglutathione lyase family enzyme
MAGRPRRNPTAPCSAAAQSGGPDARLEPGLGNPTISLIARSVSADLGDGDPGWVDHPPSILISRHSRLRGDTLHLHHTQVSMPRGQEALARRFYVEALGLVEVDKPESLAGRGGCWFRSSEGDAVVAEIHLGVEDPFVPAKRAHPAFLLDTVDELASLGERIAGQGFEVNWTERDSLEGYVRFHCLDGFGNRVEVLASVR